MSRRLVSVVVPAFDEEAFIAEALDSVLAQAYRPIEVIVVDDGSSDGTREIAAERGVRVLHQAHRGPAAARNAGLAIAQGDYWTIFDADDVMTPEGLELQVGYLEAHPELGIVFGMTEAFVTEGEPRPPHFRGVWADGPFPWHPGTLLARREVLDLVGPFDEARALGEDMEWLSRVKDAGVAMGQGDYVALRYRIHRHNTTSDTRAVNAAMLNVLRDSIRRRRAVGGDA